VTVGELIFLIQSGGKKRCVVKDDMNVQEAGIFFTLETVQNIEM